MKIGESRATEITTGNRLVALNLADGRLVWLTTLPAGIGQPVIAGSKVLCTSNDALHVLDLTNGVMLASYPAKDGWITVAPGGVAIRSQEHSRLFWFECSRYR